MNAIALHSTRPWPENARRSVERAASRWGVEIRVFDFPFEPHPSWARLALPSHLRQYSRVLVLDPDIVLSADCPDPFRCTKPGHIYMAPEWQYVGSAGRYPWGRCLAAWEPHFGPTDPREHLQGGLCLYEPETHGPLIELMHRWWVDKGRPSFSPLYEQPLWSEVLERQCGGTIVRISRLLNRHTPHPRAIETWGAHFSGMKKVHIPAVDGRGEASIPARLVRTASTIPGTVPLSALREWAGTFGWHENVVFVGAEMLPLVWLASQIVEGRVLWFHPDFRGAGRLLFDVLAAEMGGGKVTIVSSPPERYAYHVKHVLHGRPCLAVGVEPGSLE